MLKIYFISQFQHLLYTTFQKMSQMEKLLSEKGKPMLLHEGYIYTVERTTTTKLIFRCQNRDCKGKFPLNVIYQLIHMKIVY